MPICPQCNQEQEKRKKGACPNCGALVEVYSGRWYRAEIGSPATAILKHFERRVSDVLSHGRSVPVIFTIPRKGLRYKRELVAAERLLEDANYDYDLVIEAINILFEDKQFNWKTRDGLLYIERDYLLALAIARSNREIKAREKAKADQVVNDIMSREDIF